MGVPLPCFGYFTAAGAPGVYADRSTGWNKKNEQCLKELFENLSEINVSIIKNYNLEWKDKMVGQQLMLAGVHFETDTIDRPELKKLVAKLGNQGTILVPSMIHIFQTDRITSGMIKKIVEQRIAILSVRYKFKVYGSDQDIDLTKFRNQALADQISRSVVDTRVYASKFFNGRGKNSKS